MVFYGISKFDYEMREKLVEGQPLPQETQQERTVEKSSKNAWTEVWNIKIIIV